MVAVNDTSIVTSTDGKNWLVNSNTFNGGVSNIVYVPGSGVSVP